MSLTFKDRIVEYPNRYTKIENSDGTITLVPSPGTIAEAGTPLNAENLNTLGKKGFDILIDTATNTGSLANIDLTKYSYVMFVAGTNFTRTGVKINGNSYNDTSITGYEAQIYYITKSNIFVYTLPASSSAYATSGYINLKLPDLITISWTRDSTNTRKSVAIVGFY